MQRIKVLIFYNIKGWAWWNKGRQIKTAIPGDFEISCLKTGTPFDPGDYDFVLTFSPAIGHIRYVPWYKIITGCSHPVYLEDLKAILKKGKCIGGFLNSMEMYRELEGRKNVFCCQNGVDPKLFTPSSQTPEQLTACWVGDSKHVGNKGLDLIRAACEKTGVPLRYLDRHPGGQEDLLLSPEMVRDTIYFKSSVYICASQSDATPNPALEALACGLPVISTRVGNMPEIIRDGYNGYLVERSIEDIAAAIEKIKAADLPAMAKNARLSILNGWTWKQQVKKYEYMFLNLYHKQQILKKNNELIEAVDPAGIMQLAHAYKRHNELDKAERTFNKLLSEKGATDSLRSDAYYYLGGLLESQGKNLWRKHLEASNRLLISLEYKSDVQLYRIASVFKRLERMEEAEEWFHKVLKNSGNDEIQSGVLFHLGELSYKKNDLKKCRKYIEQCLKLNPGHKSAQKFLVRMDS